MPELTVLADYGDLCGEGPMWDPEKQALYWTDCVGLKFYRYNWPAHKAEVVAEGIEVNGCCLNRPGGFVVTNAGGVWLWDGHNEPQLVAAEAGGSKCQLNDCVADPAGRVLAGSNFYDPANEYPLGKLFRVDRDGTVAILDEGIHLSNGLAFSPDARTLYFTDSAARRIYAYDYDSRRGAARNRRILIQVPDEEGFPDGLTVDAEGHLWSAQWYGSCVVRYDPDGKVERRIPTPAKQTSSVAFGGPELTTIFITSAAKSEPMSVMPRGYDPNAGYFGGALYCLDAGIPGRAEYRANIAVRATT